MAGLVVPDEVTVALAEIAESATQGLLALAVGAGLQVMQTLMEESVVALAGPKSKHDPDRAAVRHGHEHGSVTLGGRRVPVQRPRVRAADGSGELPVAATSCSPRPRCWAGWRWSGCWAGCRPAATRSGSSRSAPRSPRPPRAPRSRRSPAGCRHDPHRSGRAAGRGSVHPGPGLAAGRRRPLRRAHLRGRPRHRPGRDQAPAGAGRGRHRARHPGPGAAGRLTRAGPGHYPTGPVCHRRCQGAAPRDPGRVRPAGHRQMPAAQDPQRPRQAAPTAGWPGRAPHADRLPRRLRAGRRSPAAHLGPRARQDPPRRRRVLTRGPG